MEVALLSSLVVLPVHPAVVTGTAHRCSTLWRLQSNAATWISMLNLTVMPTSLKPYDVHVIMLHSVQVAVHAFMRLLAVGGDSNSSLYAKQVITDSDAVVAQLLRPGPDESESAVRAVLGCELLAHFIAVQSTSEYAQPISKYITRWCAPPALLQAHGGGYKHCSSRTREGAAAASCPASGSLSRDHRFDVARAAVCHLASDCVVLLLLASEQGLLSRRHSGRGVPAASGVLLHCQSLVSDQIPALQGDLLHARRQCGRQHHPGITNSPSSTTKTRHPVCGRPWHHRSTCLHPVCDNRDRSSRPARPAH